MKLHERAEPKDKCRESPLQEVCAPRASRSEYTDEGVRRRGIISSHDEILPVNSLVAHLPLLFSKRRENWKRLEATGSERRAAAGTRGEPSRSAPLLETRARLLGDSRMKFHFESAVIPELLLDFVRGTRA